MSFFRGCRSALSISGRSFPEWAFCFIVFCMTCVLLHHFHPAIQLHSAVFSWVGYWISQSCFKCELKKGLYNLFHWMQLKCSLGLNEITFAGQMTWKPVWDKTVFTTGDFPSDTSSAAKGTNCWKMGRDIFTLVFLSRNQYCLSLRSRGTLSQVAQPSSTY